MRRRKGVVDVEISQRRETSREGGIVPLLFGVKAYVFEQQDLTVVQLRDRSLRNFTDAIAGKRDVRAEALRERPCDRRERERRIRLSIGPPEMGENDRLRAVLREPAQRRQRGVDPCVVADLSVGKRYVEVFADDHAFIANVEVLQPPKRHYALAGIAEPTMAVNSARRHE